MLEWRKITQGVMFINPELGEVAEKPTLASVRAFYFCPREELGNP